MANKVFCAAFEFKKEWKKCVIIDNGENIKVKK